MNGTSQMLRIWLLEVGSDRGLVSKGFRSQLRNCIEVRRNAPSDGSALEWICRKIHKAMMAWL